MTYTNTVNFLQYLFDINVVHCDAPSYLNVHILHDTITIRYNISITLMPLIDSIINLYNSINFQSFCYTPLHSVSADILSQYWNLQSSLDRIIIHKNIINTIINTYNSINWEFNLSLNINFYRIHFYAMLQQYIQAILGCIVVVLGSLYNLYIKSSSTYYDPVRTRTPVNQNTSSRPTNTVSKHTTTRDNGGSGDGGDDPRKPPINLPGSHYREFDIWLIDLLKTLVDLWSERDKSINKYKRRSRSPRLKDLCDFFLNHYEGDANIFSNFFTQEFINHKLNNKTFNYGFMNTIFEKQVYDRIIELLIHFKKPKSDKYGVKLTPGFIQWLLLELNKNSK